VLQQMDRFGIEKAMIGVGEESAQLALKMFPDRFVPSGNIDDPNDVMGSVNAIRREHEQFGIRAASVFPAGTFPQVPIDDPKMYPIYATCVELGIPIFVCAGVPGPRVPFAPQEVSRIDVVMFDFPDLVFVTRHGCEPWEDLAVKLMLKWPNLYYSTSAFAPKYYPKAIIDYANTRGADKILYAGYFPMGLSLERIFSDMPHVPLKDEVWPKFLYGNAARILGLGA
jgi:predicted TIM-barrel fold metal-dependent hydrolase